MLNEVDEMGKIIVIVGSNNKNSFTKTLAKSLLNNIVNVDNSYIYKIICLSNYNINYCEGCENCFKSGFCPIDEKDDFKEIREELYDSDIVLFASPVYVHGVPGIMKTLFDRMSCYAHLLSYAGKFGFTITTAMSNGQHIVKDYLMGLQGSLGIKNLDNYIFLHQTDSIESFVKKNTKKFFESIDKNFGYSDKKLEETFRFYTKYYGEIHKDYTDMINKYEWSYWNQNWIKECKSFQEFAAKNKKLKINMGMVYDD